MRSEFVVLILPTCIPLSLKCGTATQEVLAARHSLSCNLADAKVLSGREGLGSPRSFLFVRSRQWIMTNLPRKARAFPSEGFARLSDIVPVHPKDPARNLATSPCHTRCAQNCCAPKTAKSSAFSRHQYCCVAVSPAVATRHAAFIISRANSAMVGSKREASHGIAAASA